MPRAQDDALVIFAAAERLEQELHERAARGKAPLRAVGAEEPTR